MTAETAARGSAVRSVVGAAVVLLAASCSASTTSPTVTAPGLTQDAGASASPGVAISAPSPTPSATPSDRIIEPQASIHVGSHVTWMAAGPTAIWAVTEAGVVRIDPESNSVGATFPLEPTPDGYVVGATTDGVWVSDFDHDKVYRLDPVTGAQVASIDTPPGPGIVRIIDGAVWVANHHGGSISRIDPTSNRIVSTIKVGDPGSGGPISIVPIDGSLWVGFGDAASIMRVDPKAGKTVGSVSLPAGDGVAFAVDAKHIWARYDDDSKAGVAVLDPTQKSVASTIDLGGMPGYEGLVHGGVAWIPAPLHLPGGPGDLVGLDTTTHAVVDTLTIDGPAVDVLEAFGSAWLELDFNGTIERIPLTSLAAPH